MEPIINKQLVVTLEENPRIEEVYFEKATGLHHFNHVKTTVKKGSPDVLSVNGKEVVKMSRAEVKKAYRPESVAVDKSADNNEGKK